MARPGTRRDPARLLRWPCRPSQLPASRARRHSADPRSPPNENGHVRADLVPLETITATIYDIRFAWRPNVGHTTAHNIRETYPPFAPSLLLPTARLCLPTWR